MSGVTGDFGRMPDIEARLERARREASNLVSEKITAVIKRQFASGIDPSGRPWQPLKPATLARGRRPPPLTDTGTMKASVFVYPARLEVSIDAPAGYHQSGTRYMASRPIVPTGPDAALWIQAVRAAVREAFSHA